MSRTYLKKAEKTSTTDATSVTETVQAILNEIETGGEEAGDRGGRQIAPAPGVRAAWDRRRGRPV